MPCIQTRVLFFELVLYLTLSSPGFSPAAEAPSPPTPPTVGKRPPRDPQARAEVERALDALEAATRLLPADRFSPGATAALAGADPANILGWVSANTRWIPYAGALRGPQGVLLDRRGNSLDRALLLAKVLEAAGVRTRLAHAALDEAKAREVAAPLGRTSPPSPRAEFPDPAELDRVMVSEGVTDPEVRSAMTADMLRQQRMFEEVMGRTVEVREAIAGLLAGAERPKPPSVAGAVESDHWWVQAEEAGGKWTDLDPAFGEPGKVAAPPGETLAPGDLDVSLRHRVTVRIVIERSEGERRAEAVALERVIVPSEVIGERIYVMHAPSRQPAKPGKDVPAYFRKLALEQDRWLPILFVGKAHFAKSAFTPAGDLVDQPLEDPAAKIGRSVGGLFGGALGGARGDEKAKQGALTAEWIEFRIEAPGREPETIRREVFDLLGPAARAAGKSVPKDLTEDMKLERGLALLGETDIFLENCAIPGVFLQQLTARAMLAKRPVITAIMGETRRGSKGVSDLTPTPSALMVLSMLRWAWSPHAGDLAVDRPNIFCFWARLAPAPGGEISMRLAIDIVTNRCAPAPDTRADPFAARLEQGVLDTALEAALLGDEAENALLVFSRSRERGAGWALVRSADDAAWKSSPLPGDARAVVEADLAAGRWAIVPGAGTEVAAAWWTLDPSTGQILGRMGRGMGNALVEFVLGVVKGEILSLAVMGWEHYCKHAGKNRGGCNPCLIAFAGVLASVWGFAVAKMEWIEGAKLAGAVLVGGSTVSLIHFVHRGGECFDYIQDEANKSFNSGGGGASEE